MRPMQPLPTGGTNGRPVRIKFTNSLPTGAGGNLFVPVDTTIMGSGPYEINYDPVTNAPLGLRLAGNFRAEPGYPPSPRRPYTLDQRRNRPPVDHPGGERPPGLRQGRQCGIRARYVVHPGRGHDHRLRRPDDLRDSRRDEQPRPRVADLLLHQPAERAAAVLPRPCLGDHPPQRLCRRGRGIPDNRCGRDRPWSAAGPSMAEPTLPARFPATQIPLIIQDKTFVNASATGLPTHDHGSHLGLGIEPGKTGNRAHR